MGTLTAEQCENLSASSVGRLVVAWGDSFTEGAGATGNATKYPAVAAGLFTPDRAVANRGIGGETSTQILDRLLADTLLRPRIAWLWMGRNGAGSGHTVDEDVDAAIAALGHTKYLVGSIMPFSSDSAGGIASQQARHAAWATKYGPRFVNIVTVLQAANDGSANDLADVAAGYTPRSLRVDGGHLNDAGYAIVAAAWKNATVAMGW